MARSKSVKTNNFNNKSQSNKNKTQNDNVIDMQLKSPSNDDKAKFKGFKMESPLKKAVADIK